VKCAFWTVVTVLSGLAVACTAPRSGYDAQRDNPLGPSFWIVPTPSDDDTLLSRSFATPPNTALTLEEQSVPNPCADKLGSVHQAQMPGHYESAVDTHDAVRTNALLSLYGFSADASIATHLLYKVNTSVRVTRLDTNEYVACCKQHDCGWGYVQSLIFGEGEYAAGAEANANAQGNYSVVSGRMARSFRVKSTRAVKGYLAAVIVAHDRRQAVRACEPNYEWAKIECVPLGALSEQEQLCRHGSPQASQAFWQGNQGMQDLFWQEQLNACQWLALHGGPSLQPAPPQPAAPLSALRVEPGHYVGVSSFWSGRLDLAADGSLTRDDGRHGVWIFDGQKLTLKWEQGLAQELTPTDAPGVYAESPLGLKIQRSPE